MKRKLNKIGALCLGAMFIFGCEKEDDMISLNSSASQDAVVQNCYTINFENFSTSNFPITQVSGAYGTVGIMAMKREKGNTSDVYTSTNVARVYDANNPTGDDWHDLGLRKELGKMLMANMYTPAQVAATPNAIGEDGFKYSEPSDNAWGATIEMDFSSIAHPVTLKSIVVVDVDNNHVVENQSYVRVLDASNAIHNFPLQMFAAEGSAQTVNMNVANAKKLIVVFDGVGTSVGSGAIDNIMFCVNVPEVPRGCTRTQGYWKNHAPNSKSNKNGKTKVDPAWGSLYDDSFFSSGKNYMEVLNTPPKGDAYYILAHQYIAAKLNVAAGASIPANVLTVYNNATLYFEGKSSPSRSTLIQWAEILDAYNNGRMGVPHCN
ncbi:hypothetical protein ABID22_000679 [Pontibacter aydingkolensis]|uniref:Fimbrillin-like n=1 Tax=Pontibacter aydingkolensis TaxID=1911536 RepID=A0ABS7CRG4_9BACT|nr:hypothetical protein [Pontibacter aydingkolensis]MBW7466447.1 hypothetical protein [Pontibacter aydingkolensis]